MMRKIHSTMKMLDAKEEMKEAGLKRKEIVISSLKD